MPCGFLDQISNIPTYKIEVVNTDALDDLRSRLDSYEYTKDWSKHDNKKMKNIVETNMKHIKARERLRAKLEARKSKKGL